MRKAVRTEREAADTAATIEQAEDRLANWPTDPQMNAALDDCTRLRDAIANTMSNAATIADLNASLRTVVEYADLGVYDGELHGEFWLLETAVGLPHRIGVLKSRGVRLLAGGRSKADLMVNPGAPLGWQAIEPPPSQTGPQTFV